MPPKTTLPTRCSPLASQLTQNVHSYLSTTWTFSSEKYKAAFFAMDFPRLIALFCPDGPLDRLESAALFVCLTGILDDAFSQISVSESRIIGKKLLAIMQGSEPADPSIPLEKILHKIISDMNSQNPVLAKDVINGAIALFLAQTAKERLDVMQLDEYFAFRVRDVGGEFFLSLTRFVNNIHIPTPQLPKFQPLEEPIIKHMILANDILSWVKELKEAGESNQEGAAVCSAVPIVARNLGIGFEGARRVLWVACRELEGVFLGQVGELDGVGVGKEGERYIEALGYLASGNEEWSRTTSRYRVD
ncbi:isoprenoid synthase domain-containing protein [Aspergillus cavernicola]|uniref:Isoprenoid synthase domain-containing protein n=1 Tax=Aspergillus cavernicola TaxID=176166 RepID=A0ABR4I726_9EURO